MHIARSGALVLVSCAPEAERSILAAAEESTGLRHRFGDFDCGDGGCRSGPLSGKSLVSQLACTREFLGHMKKVPVPSFPFLPRSPHFTMCNEVHVGENAARNESDAFSYIFLPFPSFCPLVAEFRTRPLQFQGF